jgi:hypothetical protein
MRKPIIRKPRNSISYWGLAGFTPALQKRIAALRGDCELIKMTDFIDDFD